MSDEHTKWKEKQDQMRAESARRYDEYCERFYRKPQEGVSLSPHQEEITQYPTPPDPLAERVVAHVTGSHQDLWINYVPKDFHPTDADFFNVAVPGGSSNQWQIPMQTGPLTTAGANGLTIEALLAMAYHRLNQFNQGDFVIEENDSALAHIQAALNFLHLRTQKRVDRGVEGTSTP